MPELKIDRLSLRLQGVSERDARTLTELITSGLADANVGPQADVITLQSRIVTQPGSNMQNLSSQIIADLLNQLNTTP